MNQSSNLVGVSSFVSFYPLPRAQSIGLVAKHGFNEGSGTTITDLFGNNNNGTISGAKWTTAGKFGGALVFNGTNSVFAIANSMSLPLTSEMTLEAWVFPTVAPTSWRAVVDKMWRATT